MIKTRILTAAALAATLSMPAFAADPASGTLSPSNPTIDFESPLAPLANVSGLVETLYTCDLANPCDEFALKIELPEDWLEEHPNAFVQVQSATHVEVLDIDLQLADGDGNVLYNYRDNPPEQPILFIFPDGASSDFIVQVVPGTPHSGASTAITLIPGAKSKGGVLAGSLAAGALGLLGLAGLLGLRRRRI